VDEYDLSPRMVDVLTTSVSLGCVLSERETLADPGIPVQSSFQINNNQTLFHTPPDVRNYRIQQS
jgi:hypothetical protein